MVLIINAGSSSLKFKLYAGNGSSVLAQGLVERIGLAKPFLSVRVGAAGERTLAFAKVPNHAAALARVFAALTESGIDLVAVRTVGHRVVHGGEEFTAPTVVTKAVLKRLARYSKLAPLHNPPNLAGIASCMRLLPRATNVAVFDTAFYRTLPDYAYVYALPWEYYAKHGIRKYGFHGISHQYVAGEAAKQLRKPLGKLRLITCHLGSGASVTAVRNGKAIDTSMGFTPLEGLTMSTRCGDIDPAIPLYLIREHGMSAAEVDRVLNTKSGLLGVSGFKDLRDVFAAAGVRGAGITPKRGMSAAQRNRARLALDMFAYDVARYIAQFAGVMGGADAVVFTAGVGERSDLMRKRVMDMVPLPRATKTLVIPTDEEGMIAREARRAARRG